MDMRRVSFYTLAALLVAGAAITACTSDDFADEALAPQQGKTYTLSVNATKGADTRTLVEEEGALTASWNANDEIKVYKGDTEVGALKPTAAGATRLVGEVTGVAEDDVLTLKFQADADYSAQEGTLEYIDQHCSAAEATVTVTEIVGDAVNTSEATFVNQQSITKFTFSVEVPSVVINNGVDEITVTPTAATSTLYVAIPATDGEADFSFTATIDEMNYIGAKSATLANGNFYTASIVMNKIVDLSKLTAEYVAQDGDILTGKATDKYKISVAAGATVTLKDVDITSFDSEGPKYAGINCIGDATLVIEGTNHVKGAYNECSGIHIPENFTLTIEGTGKLTAESNGYGAGIGAGYYWGAAGNIIINSGEIIANGGGRCAGIGGGCERKCGDITINGGTITATGNGGAGIGSGESSACGNITINGGTITATTTSGNDAAAGIGAGYDRASCGNITITGGTITAKGCGGDKIWAGGSKYTAAGIGGGCKGTSCGNITITGADTHVVATKGGVNDYDIGPGSDGYKLPSTCGTVTIGSGVVVKDENGNDAVIYGVS